MSGGAKSDARWPSGATGGAPLRGEEDGDATWKLVASWLFVGIPAAWGVAQVIVKSMALFR